MNNLSLKYLLTLCLLSLSIPGFAQNLKVITLKDGSVLNGQALKLENGIYTVETPTMGIVTVAESDVLSISVPDTASSPVPGVTEFDVSPNSELKKQAEQLQMKILSDETLAADLQDLTADEEIQALISNPKVLDDILSFDEEKIRENPEVQNLMRNPKIQDLIQKIQNKNP